MAPSKPIVAYLGPQASYTYQATLSAFSESEYRFQPLSGIEEVFYAVESGNVDVGVIPFENSSNGSVVLTLDLFVDIQEEYPNIVVEGEIYLDVHHSLLGQPTRIDSKDVHPSKLNRPWRKLSNTNTEFKPRERESVTPNQNADDETKSCESGTCTPTQTTPSPTKPRVKPIHDISHITKLYSHPQAWGQCKNFTNTYLKGVEKQDVSSTSKAAEMVANDRSGTSAAISSKVAGQVHGLEILAEGIEDKAGNCTRFLVIRRPENAALPPRAPTNEDEQMRDYKTFVSFSVAHGQPGALSNVLQVFRNHGINLTSLNSRPGGEVNWHYVFLCELQGRKYVEGEGKVNAALSELDGITEAWRWLGSWENQLK